MKVVLIGPTFPFKGGISHYTTLLANELKKRHQVLFFSFSRPYPKFLFPGDASFDKSKAPVKSSQTRQILDWANPLSWMKIAKEIRAFKPDLIIFPWWMWGWAIPFFVIATLGKALSGAKILFVCHNVTEHETATWKKLLTQLTLGRGDSYITHSQTDLDELEKLFPKKRSLKTFHPIYEIFKGENLSKQKAQKRLGVSGNTILFFGYIRPYKGLEYLLKALPPVLKKIDITLVVAGEFWEEKEKYQKLIKELKIEKKVKIFDRYIANEEIASFFTACDLLVTPYSSATGTGVTRIALAFGKPIVGTAVGDIPEVVPHERRGLIVPPKNPEAIAGAILRCYQKDLFQEFSKNIKEDLDLFSWKRMREKIESIQG
jgi:glycosyltransferase involved in cell wall biosynthesis